MASIADALDGPSDTTKADSHLAVIAREEWARALNEFTQCHDGWLVSLDIIPPQGTPQREFEHLPLLGVSSDRLDHDGTLAISVSRSRREHLTHIVHSVERLSIERTAEGADAALWIHTRDGTHTVLRFRVPALPETVDGLAPRRVGNLRK